MTRCQWNEPPKVRAIRYTPRMDGILEQLTPPQRDAVTHVEGPLLILAGPGSGKTRVITHRIAHLLNQGIQPWQIVALTFTNKAAEEMRNRVETLAPNQPVWMGTFHRFCAQLLRRNAASIGLKENYSIYDMSDSKQAMKRAIAAVGVSTTHTSPEQIAATISRAKNRLITPEMMEGQSLTPQETIATKVYPVYQQQLLTANAVDFDDLLLHTARLLRENPEIRSELDRKFKYIMVDEYQDTNLAQYAIVRALSVDHPNLAVTGDPDQSIYGWRGADLNNILDFEKDYPSVTTVRLEQNYRSTPNVLRVADQLIRHNRQRKQKELYTDNAEGEPVVMRIFENGYQEADGIAEEILQRIAQHGARLNDFAIFCRMNALTRSVEHSLRDRSIPYQVVNGVEFYQRKEVKDLLAYLQLINNPNHDVALQRVINTPTRGIGAKTVQRIRNHADAHRIPMLQAAREASSIEGLAKRSVTLVAKFVSLYDRLTIKSTSTLEDLVRYLVEETEYEKYLEKSSVDQQDSDVMANVHEFITASVEFDRRHPDDGSLDAFLEQVALVADTDALDGSIERVSLMTLHAAKGLEFPHVFIIGVEDDLLPHSRSKGTEAEFEEERRLLFVGITRAKENLQISLCKRRAMRGDVRPVIPSPFLNELPLNEMTRVEATAKQAWRDEDFDQSYPDSWDNPVDQDECHDPNEDLLVDQTVDFDPDNETSDRVQEKPSPMALSLLDPSNDTITAAKRPVIAGLKTGTDLLDEKPPLITAYHEGVMVRHDEHGEGMVLSVTGRGPKRTAKVRFRDGDHSFRLAYAKLELIEH